MCYHKITAIKSLNFVLFDLTQVASLVVKIAKITKNTLKIHLSKQAKKPRKQAKKSLLQKSTLKSFCKTCFIKPTLQNLHCAILQVSRKIKKIKNLQTIKISKNFHTF